MKTELIVIISLFGGVLLMVLSACLTAFLGPILGEILDELEEKGCDIANKIHSRLHPELEPISLNEGLKQISKTMAMFATALNSKSGESTECDGLCGSCENKSECTEYALKERRHIYEEKCSD